WTLYYYWLHYRYQMDDRILRERVYPLLRRAMGNYLAYVERGDDGRWHLPATHSPELATVPDANYDLALLRWGLETLIASAARPLEPVSRRPALHGAKHVLCRGGAGDRDAALRRDQHPGAVAPRLGWRPARFPRRPQRLDRGRLRSSAGRWRVPGERRASPRAHRVGANRESRRSNLPSRGQRLGRGRGACQHRGGASAATHAHIGGRVRNRPVKGCIGDARARCGNVAARRDAGPPPTHAAAPPAVARAQGRSRHCRAAPPPTRP